MTTLLDETFASGIPGGFGTWIIDGSGTATITHDAGSSAADLYRSSFNSLYRLDTSGTAVALRIVMDIEITANPNTYSPGMGIGVYVPATGWYYTHALWRSQTTQVFRGASAGNIGVSESAVGYSPYAFSSTGLERCTYEFSIAANSTSGKRQFSVKRDGELLSIPIETSWFANDAVLRPCIFLRDRTIRLHSIQVYDDPATLDATIYAKAAGASFQRVAYASQPTAGKYSKATVGCHQFDFRGPGVVAGTVKLDGDPDVPASRRVRLYDQRTNTILQEQWSDPVTGSYAFTGLKVGAKYLVVAYDHQHVFRAIAVDQVEPT